MPKANSPIVRSIQNVWERMTPTDRKVGRILLSNFPMAGMQTLAELSDQAGVSSPSVMRFVKKLGFDGYPEFQRTLHREISDLLVVRARDDTSNDSLLHLPESVVELHAQLSNDVQNTFAQLQTADLAGAARLLADASFDVSLLGGAVSGPLAQTLHRRLMLLRPKCTLLSTDPLERTEKLMSVGKRDVVIVFDTKTIDQDLVAFSRLAVEQGALAIVFSGDAQSALVEQARFAFIAASSSDATSLTVVMNCLLEVLLDEIRRKIGQPADQRLRQLREVYT